MTETTGINFDTMKPEEFENVLPELFANGNGKVSTDPRLQKFLADNPDCAALVNDLETIAETAGKLFAKDSDPSDKVWDKIKGELSKSPFTSDDEDDEVKEID